MNAMPDPELMAAFQKGRAEAFETLVLRHQVGVYNFFCRLQGNTTEAEDLTQEVFLRLFQHAETYEKTAKFTTYLYRIARNCWLDWLRKRIRRGAMASLDGQEDDGGQTLYDRVREDGKGPLERLAEEEDAVLVQEAIGALPEDQRVVFVLGEIEGMRYAEIGETLEIPEGTVKSRMHAAVLRLRERLGPRLGEG